MLRSYIVQCPNTECDTVTRRKITFDANTIISYIITKKKDSLVRNAINKAKEIDQIMLTDIIEEEVIDFADKPQGMTVNATRESMRNGIAQISAHIIILKPIPSNEELAKKYQIRDWGDLKIIESSERTESEFLITYDRALLKAKGVKAKVGRPEHYLYEDWDWLDEK